MIWKPVAALLLLCIPIRAGRAETSPHFVRPLAYLAYAGGRGRIGHGAVEVSLHDGTSTDAATCRSGSGKVVLGSMPAADVVPCGTVVASIHVDGALALRGVLATFDLSETAEHLYIQASIRQLEGSPALPQVVLTGYSRGLHCCTFTAIASRDLLRQWSFHDLGKQDGDLGYRFLKPNPKGPVALVGFDGSFNYRFDSYGDSLPGSQISMFRG